MRAKKVYTVEYERDESGWWVASVPEIDGCHTQGRTIEQARERIREAIQACLDLPEPYGGKLADEVRIPAGARKAVAAAKTAKEQAQAAEATAFVRSREALAKLLDLGLSLRDAGELLGVSRQRAQKLSKG
jgi:predicted RNase H-like HicB family nuclease